MPASLIARSITVIRGRQTVLDAVDVTLSSGHRFGLVGPNGVGKSTLLSVLAGLVAPDGGTVERAPRSATVGLLAQEPDRVVAESVGAFLARRTGVAAAQQRLDESLRRLADGATGADDEYSAALEQWLSLGAADFDARVGSIWSDLGLDERILGAPTSTLSGGEMSRCSLASLLLAQFDIVLLDEPTNDLDLDALDRLEAWVLNAGSPLMLVSHDRSFLERVVTDVVEIDHHSHAATSFAGGWGAFRTERQLQRQHAQERFDQYDTDRKTLQRRAQREREWAQQGQSKLKKSGETDKHIRHFKLNQTEQLAGRAARTERAMERLDVVDEPRDRWELRFSIPFSGRSGDRAAWASGAIVELTSGDGETFRLGPVDVAIDQGDRVAILGPNGAGKSTLLGLLLGRIEPMAGTAGLGSSVRVGEIEQARLQLDGESSLVRLVTDGTGMTTSDARTLLAKFELRADHVDRPTASLSPGERTRAVLALLMAAGANLLVLDEPTNHLDIEAIEQLEVALDAFAGTILLVTHDRTFLERFRTTRTIRVDGGHCTIDG